MATQSVQKDREGPDWPLGLITPTINTPLSIMSNVDPTLANDPSNPTAGGVANPNEYTERCNQIVIWGVKAAGHGLQPNTGNIYVCRKGVQGAGNRDDYGSVVAIIFPGQAFTLVPSALVRDGFSPYRYFIDADNQGDSALVTLIIV